MDTGPENSSDAEPVIPLDYARPQKRHWPVWLCLLGRFVWAIVVIDIYGLAVIGVWFTIYGIIINFFHPIEGLEMFGKPVKTPQKVQWLVENALLNAAFIPLAIWHARRLCGADAGESRDRRGPEELMASAICARGKAIE